MPQYAKVLFTSLWGKAIEGISDNMALKTLLRRLDHHPLSIVLVASQGWRFSSVQAALDEWESDAFHDGMQVDKVGRHQNLRKAIHMSYMSVKNNLHALTVWAILSYIPSALSEELFAVLFADNLPGYQAAANLLIKQSLVKIDKTGYIMLNPIKNIIFSFTDNDTLRQNAISRLREGYALIFMEANQLQSPDYMRWHHLAIENLIPILDFLEKTIVFLEKNVNLIMCMHNYFSYSPQLSLHLLTALMKKSISSSFSAFLNQYSGDLERRLGQIEDAKLHYAQAEQLYRDEKANLGLANALQSMGDLESRLGQIEDAKLHYAQAEQLYRDEKDNLGLAYTCAELSILSFAEEDKPKADAYIEEAKICAELSCAPHAIEYVNNIIQAMFETSQA